MDKNTLSNYGWIVIAVLVLSVMIALATPFGQYVEMGVRSTTEGLFSTSQNAMNSAFGDLGVEVKDQTFEEGYKAPNGDETEKDDENKVEGIAVFNKRLVNPHCCDDYDSIHNEYCSWETCEEITLTWDELKTGKYADELGYKASGISDTNIDYPAFYGCQGLIKITIPESVTNIGDSSFQESGLISINIPDGVTNIGESAFDYCQNLTNVTIPDSVTTMGEYAFYECGNLVSITIPGSITSISDYSFLNCVSLSNVTICNGVTNISYQAFSYCKNLTSITIPDSVTNIDVYAFFDCESLTSITIPCSVTNIGESAFGWCESLTDIIFNGTMEQWNEISLGTDWNSYDSRGEIPATVVHCSDGNVAI